MIASLFFFQYWGWMSFPKIVMNNAYWYFAIVQCISVWKALGLQEEKFIFKSLLVNSLLLNYILILGVKCMKLNRFCNKEKKEVDPIIFKYLVYCYISVWIELFLKN